MFLEIITSVALCYAIGRFSVIAHELGHVFALCITRKRLKLENIKLLDNIIVVGFSGKTFSPIYEFLSNYSYKTNPSDLRLIKFNAIMGYVFEIAYLIIVFSYLVIFTVYNYNIYSLYLTTYTVMFFIYTVKSITDNPSDIKIFKNPSEFEYNNSFPKFELRKNISVLLFLIFTTSAFTTLIYFIFQLLVCIL